MSTAEIIGQTKVVVVHFAIPNHNWCETIQLSCWPESKWTWKVGKQLYIKGGGGSHIDIILVCACLLGCFFAKFGLAISEFSQSPNYINWVYFEQIIVKKHPILPKLGGFLSKMVTDGPVIGQKIGIEKVKFLRSGRYIHWWFWQSTPKAVPKYNSLQVIHNNYGKSKELFTYIYYVCTLLKSHN